MIFNSVDFAVFLPIVFGLYWFIFNKNRYTQNSLILVASYFFYGWWDWRFLFLLFFSTIVDDFVGIALDRTQAQKKRKLLLMTSIVVNLGFLGFFKYYNFFVQNFIDAFSFFGHDISPNTLDIILPVGISFYTFQTLSYSIDVYRKKLEPTTDFVAFAAFVTFFPQLVAGPIERATNLLPQFYTKRSFDQSIAVDGLRQALWGFFKKIVIADNCAAYANTIFNDSSSYSGATLLLGAVFFGVQIYGDFSGYSDIAIGTARLFGVNLMQNFAYPYFSRDIGEFWRRWHISLSTWFRDYLYIPLGGSRGSTWTKIRNIFIIFLVSGFWHGANWTFIVWGALNAIYFLPLLLRNKNRINLDVVAQDRYFPSLRELCDMLITFALTTFAWIFFRSESVEEAFDYVGGMVGGLRNLDSFKEAYNFVMDELGFVRPLLFCLFFILEWMGRHQKYALENLGVRWSRKYRWSFYYLLILMIILYSGQQQEFIYFQF